MLSEDYLLDLVNKEVDENVTKNTIINQRNCPFIKYSKNQLSVKYVGKGLLYSDITSIQSNTPAQKDSLIYYYEVHIENIGQRGDICIGLADKDFPLNKHPGWTRRAGSSYGYRSDGRVYSGKQAIPLDLEKFTTQDTIGCGINYLKKEIFFTHNGQQQSKTIKNIEVRDFYATIGLHSPDEKITFNFGKQPFKFNIKQHKMQQKRESIYQILQQNVHTYSLHQIVHSYLYHQGYFETLYEFEKSCQLKRKNVYLLPNQQKQSTSQLSSEYLNQQIQNIKKQYSVDMTNQDLLPEPVRKVSYCLSQTEIKGNNLDSLNNTQSQQSLQFQKAQSSTLLQGQVEENKDQLDDSNRDISKADGIEIEHISGQNNNNSNSQDGQIKQPPFKNPLRKLTDDIQLVKERVRSESFNIEFETPLGILKKDSIDINDMTLMKEFSTNFEQTEKKYNQLFNGQTKEINENTENNENLKQEEAENTQMEEEEEEEQLSELDQYRKNLLEKYRKEIRQEMNKGNLVRVIELLQLYYPKIMENNDNIKSVVYYQMFIELIRAEKITEGIQFMQDNSDLLRNKTFYTINDQGLQIPVDFEKVFGVIGYQDINHSEIKYLFNLKQRQLVADLINQAILCEMGHSDKSVLEVLIKQLIYIEEIFKQECYAFGGMFNFKV